MKSLIEFPEEVATPSSSSSQLVEKESGKKQAIFDTIGFDNSDCETDQSTSSTSSESENDSVSDIDENDVSSLEEPVGTNEDLAAEETVNNNNVAKRRSVSFGPIHVRQYERIVGDHPETKVGVPLAIGWAYYEDEQHPDGISIDRYESDRIQRGKLRLSSITRKNMMLHVFKLDEEEIRMAEKRSSKLRKQNTKLAGGSQSPLKRFGKKIRKGGMTVLKGMSQAAQFGSGSGLLVAVDHAF